MTTETMTVHEALCEAKTMSKRIDKVISNITAVGVKEHKSDKVNGISISDFTEDATSRHTQAMQMINRHAAIKAAINMYNATEHISVSGKDYTIAQAIWLMNHGMDAKKELRDKYANTLASAQTKIALSNGDKLNQRAEQAANVNFGTKEKTDTEEYLKFISEYKARNEAELVDPLNISKIIRELDDEIAEFESHVDSAIQVANATHTIDIEY